MSIGLELELQSCKGIYALRHQYHKQGPFFLYLLSNVGSNPQNSQLLARKLPNLAATYAPFDMELYNLHRTTETEKRAVKYSLQSKKLWDLRFDVQAQFANAIVFENIRLRASHKGPRSKEIRTLHQDVTLNPLKYHQPLHVAIKNKMVDIDEADRILQEVGKIDPKMLGKLKAIGLRLSWLRSRDSPRVLRTSFRLGENHSGVPNAYTLHHGGRSWVV